MCGILAHFGKIDRQLFVKMTESQKHRGPDHTGYFFNESKQVSLGHTRLAVVDLTPASHGPFFSPCKNYGIIFNGEIYNAPELRKDIEKNFRNINFITKNSDTEVLLNSYIAFDFDMFDKIEGMFAFVIVDFIKNKILLARDRFGQKPLHYCTKNGDLTISSELTPIKILYRGGLYRDDLSVAKFLAHDAIPAPRTLYKDVYQVCPASYISFDLSNLQKRTQSRYWHLKFNRNNNKINQEKLIDLIKKSVKKCSLADVPCAALLSGGLDSTVVGYFLKEEVSPLHSFNFSSSEKSFDETYYANIASETIGSYHKSVFFEQEYYDEKIFSLYKKLDSPNGDSGLIPSYFLCKEISKNFKTVIGGDGGDEIFFGYDTHIAYHLTKKYVTKFPKLAEKLIFYLRWIAPLSRRRLPLAFKIQRFSQVFNEPPPFWAASWMNSLNLIKINQLLDTSFSKEEIFDEAFEFFSETDSCSQDQFNSYYLNIYLPSKVLAKVDRSAMLNGLEVRSPLLDKDIFEYCSQFSITNFHNGWKGKLALREIVADKINVKLANKLKMGFGFPIASLVEKDFLTDRLLSQKNMDRKLIKSLQNDHINRKIDYGQSLWNIFVLSFFE